MYDTSGKAQNKTNPQRQLEHYAPLVKRLAHQMKARLPENIEVDDLVQVGMVGLLDALERYEEQGHQFETYAIQRIRGAMLDELRSADWLPRSARQNLRKIEAAVGKLQQQLRRHPAEAEIARELEMSVTDYHQMLSEGAGHQLVYYEDFSDGEGGEHFLERQGLSDDEDPLAQLMDAGFRSALIDSLAALPEREQQLMAMIYQEEMNLAEVGAVLGVSASRVCQLHSQAIARMRVVLKSWTGAA